MEHELRQASFYYYQLDSKCVLNTVELSLSSHNLTVLHNLQARLCLPQLLQIPPTDHWAKGYVISSIIEAPAHVLICLSGLIKRCVGPQNPKPSCSHVLPACRSSQILFSFAFREHVAAHLSTGRETISLLVSTASCTLIMVCFCSVIHQSPVCYISIIIKLGGPSRVGPNASDGAEHRNTSGGLIPLHPPASEATSEDLVWSYSSLLTALGVSGVSVMYGAEGG